MQIDHALGQIRPVLALIGSILIAIGLIKYFGVNIPVGKNGLELAVAGFLLKSF